MAITWIGSQSSSVAGAAVQMPPANYKVASRYQNDTGADMTVQIGWANWGVPQDAANIMFIVYADVAGAPGALLHTSSPLAIPVSYSSHVFTFPTPWVWPAGVWLWLGLIADHEFDGYGQFPHVGLNNVIYNVNNWIDGPSDPFGTFGTVDFQYMVWVEGYDTLHRFGRTQPKGYVGSYYANDQHFELFHLGDPQGAVGGASSVSVASISVYCTAAGAVPGHACIVAADGVMDGTPNGGTLLGVTDENPTTIIGWNVYTFTPPLVIPAPADYWLGFVVKDADIATNVTSFNGHLSTMQRPQATADYTFPNPIPIPSQLAAQGPNGVAIYASYTPIGGGGGGGGVRRALWMG